MKRIKIQNYTAPDLTSVYTRNHYYCVFLSEGRRFYFKNETKLKRFIAETNRFYNSVLHEYNYLYTQILTEYRLTWFHMPDRLILQIREQINQVENVFNLVCVKSSHSINGNPLTFQYLIKINTLLRDIAISLRLIKTEKEFYNEVQRTDIFINQLAESFNRLNNWGKNYDGTILDIK